MMYRRDINTKRLHLMQYQKVVSALNPLFNIAGELKIYRNSLPNSFVKQRSNT